MDKIKRYIDCSISTEACNLRCHYCYITQKRQFNNKINEFSQPISYIRKAFSKERLGGVCLFNLCAGGETLLPEYMTKIIYELLQEGHYVMVVTNGTLKSRFIEISKWPIEFLERLFFKFSFHYLELIRLNMLDRFCDNVELMKKSGASFTIEVTPSDELIPYIDEMKEVCIKKFGALCHITIARDETTAGFDHLSNYSFEEYCKIWGVFDSKLFDFKSSIFYKKRREFCYAGDWSITVELLTGEYKQCNYEKPLGNIYADMDKPLCFEAVGQNCSMAHCYNGHSFLVFGDIPDLNINYNYAQLRNRVCTDGSEWLGPVMKDFMSTKLIESNKEYSCIKKYKVNHKNIHGVRGHLSQFKFYQKLHDIKTKNTK